jgi:glycosyltransferase involved in cell wall biosynthesis
MRCTVAIPVFNRERLVGRAIESALDQHVDLLEIVIVDNCSTDRTWHTIRSFNDPRIRAYRNDENIGLFPNFNRCLSYSTGTWLRFLCSDDRLPRNCLKNELDLAENASNCAILNTTAHFHDHKDRPIVRRHAHIPAGQFRGSDAIVATLTYLTESGFNPFNYPSGVLLNRRIAIEAGGFDESFRSLGDVDLFLRMLRYGNLYSLAECGAMVAIHPFQEGVSLNKDGTDSREWLRLITRHTPELDAATKTKSVRHSFFVLCRLLALLHWYTGNQVAARACQDCSLENDVSLIPILSALLRLFKRRILLKLARRPFFPRISTLSIFPTL